ncbi:MAG: pyridoxamine 5'-phosphate oxidase, partial [Flavobacteriaceae bacterium]|nr:pyridoxamine 5'-phosphate oxidase [Flavobacteriaceae bacterium]
GADGFPKNRVLLLKEFSEEGFVFYTNYRSEKGRAIETNNKVSLSFYWPQLERQVIIKGHAQKISNEESEEYFHSRPKGSQLGAYVSDQSSVIPDRDSLELKLRKAEKEFADAPVPKPKDWGGYIVVPCEMEFWQGRENRLHDRIRFTLKSSKNWQKERLAP